MSWNRPSLDVEVLNGTVVVKSVSFVPNKSIATPVFHVETVGGDWPIELANIIEVRSSKSSALTVGDEVQVGVNFDIASNIPAGNYQAALHVQDGTMELLQPLEIHLKVKEGSAQIIPQGLAVATHDRIIIDPEHGGQYIKDAARIIVNEGADMNAVKSLVAGLGGYFEGEMERYNFFQIRFLDIESAETLDFLINQLQDDPNIMVASPDFIHDARQLTPPNDTEYENNEWIEQFDAIGNNAHLLALKIFAAWNEVYSEIDPKDAKKIKIAIIDTGFDREHLDLKDNINKSLSYEFSEGKDKDHGTAVAGVVGAVANNAEGIAGIVWNPDLILRDIPLKSAALAVMEMEWAAINGAKIINYSYGKTYPKDDKFFSSKSLDWILYTQLVVLGRNALFVFPVENPNNMQAAEDVVDDYPAVLSLTHDNVISVGGFSPEQGGLIRFGEGGKVDVAAPNYTYTTSPGNGYRGGLVGTSYSAPMITGIAGLLLTKNENLTPQQLKKIIITGACLGNEQIANQISTSDHVIFAANAYESLKLANIPDAICTNAEGQGSIEVKRIDLNGNPLASTIATTAQLDGLGPKTENPALFENIKVSAHPYIIKVTDLPEYKERVAFCSEPECVPGENGSLYLQATCNGTVCKKQIYVKNDELTKVNFIYRDCAIGYVKAANGIECISDSPTPAELYKKQSSLCVATPPALAANGKFYGTAQPDCNTATGRGVVEIEPSTGAINWGPTIASGCSYIGPLGVSVGSSGLVYATGDWNACGRGNLIAVRQSDGEIEWDHDGCGNTSPHPRQIPAIDESKGSIYFGSSQLCSVNMDTGIDNWNRSGGRYIGGDGIVIDSTGNVSYGTYDRSLNNAIRSYTSNGDFKWERVVGLSNSVIGAVTANDSLLINFRPSSSSQQNAIHEVSTSGNTSIWPISGIRRPVFGSSGEIYASIAGTSDVVSVDESTKTESWRVTLPSSDDVLVDFVTVEG